MKHLAFAAAAAFAICGQASAQMSLNTGYNYATFNLYAQPSGTSTIQDNYWIKIAGYEPPATTVSVAPAWVLAQFSSWLGLPNARWIGPFQTPAGSTTASAATPGYNIYRKCFCLMPNFQNPILSFRLRADDNMQVWLNTVTTVLVPPTPANYNNAPVASLPTNAGMFRTGVNCLYVLVENIGGPTGFVLTGSVSATGLMPAAGAGAGNSFAPCTCPGANGPGTVAAAASAAARRNLMEDDAATVRAIIAYAEARRLRRAGTPR